jgi:hypothetical protein
VRPGIIAALSSGVAATDLPQSARVVARWSADAITPQADNTNLASWTDSIGGFAATQATTGRQPKYRTNRMGGKPSVQFGGAALLNVGRPAALVAALDAVVERTIFVVYKTLGATSSGMLFTAADGAGAGIMIVADQSGVGLFNSTVPSPGGAFMSYAHACNQPAPLTTQVYRQVVNGGVVSPSQNMPNGTAGLNIGIGGIVQSDNFFCNADIYEVIVWDRGLSPGELLQAHKWACDKYGQAYPWAGLSKFTVYDGDSITMGSGSPGSSSYPYKSAASLGLTYGQWTNIGIGGITAANLTSKAAVDLLPIGTVTGLPLRIAAFEWYNQRAAHPGPYNNSLAYLAAVRSATRKVSWGTSTDTSVTTDADRAAYNAAFDADHSTCDAYVAIHSNTAIGTETAYANNPGNFSDTVHLSSAGNTVLASLMTTGLTAIA